MEVDEVLNCLQNIVDTYDEKLKPSITVNYETPDIKISKEMRNACSIAYDMISYWHDNSCVGDDDIPYPRNLMLEIGLNKKEILNAPEDGIEHVLSLLSERENKIMHLRFKEQKTLEEIANMFNVSRSWINVIIIKCLGKLRYPTNKNIIRHGVNYMNELNCAKNDLLQAKKEINLEITKVLGDKNLLCSIINADKKYEMDKHILEDFIEKYGAVGIDALNLSVRAYNALLRSGHKKLSDIAGLTTGDLLKIRNLGLTSAIEIMKKVWIYGIKLKDDIGISEKIKEESENNEEVDE